jgi:branched-chain amino acid transport system substrate-binding protein
MKVKDQDGLPRQGRRGRVALALAALGTSLVLAACGSSAGDDDSGSSESATGSSSSSGASTQAAATKLDKPIVFGAPLAHSALQAPFDGPPLAGFKLWMDDVNKKGGILGQKVSLLEGDTRSSLTAGRQVAQDLIDKGAQAMILGANFDYGVAAAQVTQAKGLTGISLGAASPKFGIQGIGKNIFTAGVSTYSEAQIQTQFGLKQFGPKVFAICDTSIDYTTEICTGIEEQLPKRNGKLVGRVNYKTGDTSFASLITKIKSSPDMDWIYLGGFAPTGPSVLRQLRAAGIDKPIVSEMAMDGTYWTKAVPNISDFWSAGLASIAGDDPKPDVNELTKRFTDETGSAPLTSQYLAGYMVGQLYEKAINDAGSMEASKLTAALENFRNVETLLGPVTFTDKLHMSTSRPLTFLKYTKGKMSYDSTVQPEGFLDLHVAG